MTARLGFVGKFGCIAAVALACGAGSLPAHAEPPEVFSKMTWAEAKTEAGKGADAANSEPRLVLLDFTAEWCGPCKMMDKSTWRDETVEKWIADNNAIAIQVDVDKDRATATEFRVSAMPTVVLVRGDKTLDRSVGLKTAPQLIAWLDAAKGGKREIDAVKERAAAGGGKDVDARYDLARNLVQEGELEKATEEYLWLFDNMVKHKPSMVGVRNSFLIGDINRLCQQHPPARELFAKRRDELETKLKGGQKSWEDLNDWIVLNEAVDEQDKTIEWFDRIKDQPDSAPTLRRFSFRLERLLIERERWPDIGRMIKDPKVKVRQEAAMLEMDRRGAFGGMNEAQREEMRAIHERMFRDNTAIVYAGLLAAGREDDAKAAAAEAEKALPGDETRKALIRTAIKAQQARPDHLRWIESLPEKDGDKDALRRQVEQSLERQSKQG